MNHPTGRSRATLLVALVVAAVLLAGIVGVGRMGLNYYERHRTFSPTTALDEQCDDVPSGAQRITLTGSDGVLLGAAIVGPSDAEVGLVLRQGASQKICEWLPWAGRVAAETGTRVLLFDRRGRGSTPAEGDLGKEPDDTRIAVDHLRATGTPRVALAASSMGNSIMFSTLPSLEPAPCAVLAISPVLVSGDANGVVDGSGLRDLPENLWVTWEEGNAGVAANAERILARAGTEATSPESGSREDPDVASPQALAVDTDDHSRQLVLNHPSVQRFFLDAMRSCS
jgi:pimeloyl-ACP methyl ester carboxylesterase